MARRESFGAYYFKVEVNNKVGFFRSCSGLKSESEVQELPEGGLNSTTHKLMGRTKFPNIVLKQGFAVNDQGVVDWTLFDLRASFVFDSGAVKRINGTITQMGPSDNRVAKWGFENGFVVKWEGPEFDASKNEVSIETIEIAHELLKKIA